MPIYILVSKGDGQIPPVLSTHDVIIRTYVSVFWIFSQQTLAIHPAHITASPSANFFGLPV